MMIPATVADKLNDQIAHEFHAAHIYLAIACKLDGLGLKNLSKWFRLQGEEEREHGLKILDYLQDVGAEVKLKAIAEPKANFASVEAMVQAALEQEQTVTKQVYAIVDLAREHNDHATHNFIQWFVNEQVEEVSTMSHLLQTVKMAGGPGLLQVESWVARTMAAGK